MNAMTGKCLCGAVNFTASGVELHHHVCHCGMCRRWTGGPQMAAATERVSFVGEENLGRYDSSDWAQRGFCKVCGSSLFYLLKPTGQYMLSIGAFDDPSKFQLVREIFIDHKPAGYAFAGELARLTEAQVFAQYAGPGSK